MSPRSTTLAGARAAAAPRLAPQAKPQASTLLRARVDTARYRKAEQVFSRLGMKTSDAINVFLAQVALREDLPFAVTAHPERLLSDPQQAQTWNESLGDY